MKLEQINAFLSTLKVLHKMGNADFTIFCNKCGSKNCQVMFFPEAWTVEILDKNAEAQERKNAIGLKCLDCGCAGNVPYNIEETIYG